MGTSSIPSCFELVWAKDISSYGLHVNCYHHQCGMEVICVSCPDPENVFIAGFSTPGYTDTGVQHIIEHTVLGGSKNYQVKSPFDELYRGSLATYVNAETYPTRTLYPFASINRTAFFNGVDVYLDAVFNPTMAREAFMQEGWHYEIQQGSDGEMKLQTSGIVLNEMRTLFYSASDMVYDVALRELFPGTPLAHNSGGIPGEIEKLTYESYLAYYREHYHPSKARIYFYGDICDADKLSALSEYLDKKCTLGDQVASAAEFHQDSGKWYAPRCVQEVIPLLPGKSSSKGCTWCLAWAIGTMSAPGELLSMVLLNMLLLEDDSSPLRRALNECGLCDDVLSGSGLCGDSGELLFLVGGVECSKASFDKLRVVVLDCLEQCRRKGFEADHVKATFNQLRMKYQDMHDGFGRSMGRLVMRNWLSGLDPLQGKDYVKEVEILQAKIEADPRYLSEMLRRVILDNCHRVEIRFVPDKVAFAKKQQAAEQRLEKLGEKLLAGKPYEKLTAQLKALASYQNRVDTPEALDSFPQLKRGDLSTEPFEIASSRDELSNGTVMVRAHLPFAGINYMYAAYDLGMFTPEEMVQLPVFLSLLDDVGVKGCPYDEFERRLALAGAGLEVSSFSVTHWKDQQLRGVLLVRAQGLSDTWGDTLGCYKDRFAKSVFDERGRMRESVRQDWSQLQESLTDDYSAYYLAMGRSSFGLCPSGNESDIQNGVWAARVALAAKKMICSRRRVSPVLMGMLEKLSKAVPLLISYAGDDAGYESLCEYACSCGQASGWTAAYQKWISSVDSGEHRCDGIDNGKKVFCSARSFMVPTAQDDYQMKSALMVYSSLLSNGYLMDAIRLKGGAYGGGCMYSNLSGLFTMFSYRDGKPAATQRVYNDVLGYTEDWTEKQITGGIISCIRGDIPHRTNRACKRVLLNEICGATQAERRVIRRAMLDVSLKDIRIAAEYLRSEAESNGWNDCFVGDERFFSELGARKVDWPEEGK